MLLLDSADAAEVVTNQIEEAKERVGQPATAVRGLTSAEDVVDLASRCQRSLGPPDGLTRREGLFPSRRRLCTKVEIRCQECVAHSLPGILLRPEIAALKPKRNMKWFRKQAVANAMLPRVQAEFSAENMVTLTLSNPLGEEVFVTLQSSEVRAVCV